MITEDIYLWMKDHSLLNNSTLDELKAVVCHYPYFQQIRFLYLKNLYLVKDPDFYSELKKSSPYISDHRKLFYYLSVEDGIWNNVFAHFANKSKIQAEIENHDTISLIDSFLSDYAPEMLINTPQNPTHRAARLAIATQDYSSLLINKELEASLDADLQENAKLKNHDLIDEFISFAGDTGAIRQQLSSPKADEPIEELPESLDREINVLDDDYLMTESLAKIYIKQKRYYKAVEIIRKLSLKYPEKSIYFADQIRFLEKLITNIKKEE